MGKVLAYCHDKKKVLRGKETEYSDVIKSSSFVPFILRATLPTTQR
jgi:hypothetical protein